MRKKKEKFNLESRQSSYLRWGSALFILGVVTTLLNVFLPVPDYQKISNFSVLFFTAGGGLVLIFGAPRLRDSKYEFLRNLAARMWVPVTATVFICFGLLIFDRTEGSNYVLTGLIVVVYVLFIGYAKATRELPSQFAKAVETAEVLVVAITLAIFIKGVGIQAFKIPSGSMLPTLQIGDQLLVTKFLYGVPLPYTDMRLPAVRDIERGDIVVFIYPGMDNPDKPEEVARRGPIPMNDVLKGEDFIKRVIGLPGDKVEVKGVELWINGEKLDDQWGAYDNSIPPYARSRQGLRPFVVPDGYYFVMGDNRDHSNDSRFWGFVKKGRVRGKAFIIYFSTAGLNRIGTTL